MCSKKKLLEPLLRDLEGAGDTFAGLAFIPGCWGPSQIVWVDWSKLWARKTCFFIFYIIVSTSLQWQHLCLCTRLCLESSQCLWELKVQISQWNSMLMLLTVDHQMWRLPVNWPLYSSCVAGSSCQSDLYVISKRYRKELCKHKASV